MRDIYAYAIVSGILFGFWPLLMNRSGLDGFASAALFTAVAFLVVAPVALWSGQVQQISFTPLLFFALAAGVCGGLGVLVFNTGLAKVTTQEVGMLFIIMLMFQLAVPAVYHMIQTGDYSPRTLAGIAGAFLVVYLLGNPTLTP
jgi:drug/metabolite transporter (DMT)-like permease